LARARKVLLFTAYEGVRDQANAEPAIDAFLLKTHMDRLLPLARELLGIDRPA